MQRGKSKSWQRRIIAILSVGTSLALWELLVKIGVLNAVFLPAPTTILEKTFELYQGGQLTPEIIATLQRVSLGFVLAVLIGLVLAVLCYVLPLLEHAVSPLVELIRSIAPLALLPAFMLLFGIGYASKVAIIVWVAWIPVFLNTLEGKKSADPILIKAASSMGANRWRIAAQVILPSAMPFLFAGLRLAIGSAFLVLVAAEMMGANCGLGYYILDTSQTFRIVEMYAAIFTIGGIGLLINAVLMFVAKAVAPWEAER